MMPTILKIYPAGTSVKVAVHVYQVLTTGMQCNLILFVLPIMRLFKGNFESLYHRTDPHAKDSPLTGYTYNMSKVVAPISLHYGDGDTIVRKQVRNFPQQQYYSKYLTVKRFRNYQHLITTLLLI